MTIAFLNLCEFCFHLKKGIPYLKFREVMIIEGSLVKEPKTAFQGPY